MIGLFSLLKKALVIRWLQRLGAKISAISIRNDLKHIFQSTYTLDDKWTILALIGVTVIGIFIRLIQINNAVGYDEAYTFIHFASRSLQVILTDYSAPNNHIFHSLMVYIGYHIFGNHVWALRLPAFLAGVLTIPAIYMAGKVIYGKNAALIAAALVACTPILVDFSVNARGYTLMCLFSCLILWIAGILRKQSSFTGWLLLSLFSILGFYTLPVMVYPVSAVFLWLLVSWVVKDINSNSRGKFIFGLIVTSISTILITFLLYSPILIFGSGFSSITSNEFVKSQSWLDFLQSVQSRIPRVWGDWNYLVPSWVALHNHHWFHTSHCFRMEEIQSQDPGLDSNCDLNQHIDHPPEGHPLAAGMVVPAGFLPVMGGSRLDGIDPAFCGQNLIEMGTTGLSGSYYSLNLFHLCGIQEQTEL